MKIVVCVKQVPDSTARVVVEQGKVSWGDAPMIMNPWDEYAVEAALRQKEAGGGTVTAISIGDESSKESLKRAIAMGAEDAILISDPALVNLDTQAAARVLVGAIQKIGGVELVFLGRQAIDGDAGLVPVQTARLLGWPSLSLAASIKIEGGTVHVERGIEEGRQAVTSHLPAVISISKDYGEPRYPSFMGIRKASKAEIPTWTLAELGMSAPASVIQWPEMMNPPSREVTCEFITGGSPEEIAETLADKILAEKVL
jgi:electron transfer flavoprotein beta subunit